MSNKNIPFTKQDIQKYLDKCIIFWREQRKKEHMLFADYYIDAFQSVRKTLFGELLPEPDPTDVEKPFQNDQPTP